MDKSTLVVETEWLEAELGAPDLAIVDGSWHLPAAGRDAHAEYLAGHIPGAVHLDIDTVADTTSGLPHMLPSPDDFAAAVGALGIGDGMRIVVYDADGLFSSARVWWMFRVMGAERVALLNGGLSKWKAEGRTLEPGPVAPAARKFTPRFDAGLVRDISQMRQVLDGKTTQVLDCRSPGRFAGDEPEPRPGVRAGHMPGAVNLHYARYANPDGTIKDREGLAAVFEEAGVDIDRPIVTTCGSGVTAAIPILALAILGRQGAAVYDGSWSEWGAAADTPVATGLD